ncbi:MAG TPA: hypothetical protein VNB29_07310, partial [Chthoniobacterales bacterium]|nr:hypothetical protein [Chthoniobacterales bacterium]
AVVLATALWLITDLRSGHVYMHEVARYWNGSARLIIYGLFVYGLSLYTKTVEANRKRLEEMRALIPICHNCGKIFASDGTWLPIEEAVKQSLKVGRECPDCLAAEVDAK